MDGKISPKTTTKQVKTLKNGNPINKAAQFGQPNGNPRHNGAWKKEDTPRYKLEQMMKLTDSELGEIYTDKDAPLFERRLANAIKHGDWKIIESMINQVYGFPKQEIKQTNIEVPAPRLPKNKSEE